MLLDLAFPQGTAGCGVDRVDVTVQRTHVHCERAVGCGLTDDRGRSDAAARRERPVSTPRPCVERINRAVLTADEEASADHARLAPRGVGIAKSERPLQLQL